MLVRFAFVVFALAACSRENTLYCEGHPEDVERCPASDSGTTACTTDNQCGAQVCDTARGVCVQCTADKAGVCSGATPVCDVSQTCRACSAHAECGSNVCLPAGAANAGACAAEAEVAYVSASGSGTECSQAAPCALLSAAIATGRPYVKVASAAQDANKTTIDAKVVTILGEPGAKLDRSTDGPILEVSGAGADVRIFDLEISGATMDYGIVLVPNGGMPKLALTRATITNNQGGGISTTGGALTLTQSTISLNLGGGISVTGSTATFDITNCFIYRNGDIDNGTFGGANLGIATAGSNRFEFNTVVDNRAAINSGGIICNVPAFAAANNLIARNSLAGSATATDAQELGACTYPTSKIQNDMTGLAFEDSEAPAPYSYKLTSGSSAVDQATTPSTVGVDNGGDARPQGSGKDIGADELMN